ncbi:4Fe-4S binding protein [Alkalibaculum sporogenes]|nr:4Fe-4S binding protein [Alkalibaculum sporogenes]
MKNIKKAVISNQCVACGTCVSICPFNAINIFKGIRAVVDVELCVGCGKCKSACPGSIIEIQEMEESQ